MMTGAGVVQNPPRVRFVPSSGQADPPFVGCTHWNAIRLIDHGLDDRQMRGVRSARSVIDGSWIAASTRLTGATGHDGGHQTIE
jgi:hypothetical protein